jgi:ubiquitin carboxyl-terminal hydrolase 34
MNSMM